MTLREIYERLKLKAEREGRQIDEGTLKQQAWVMRDRIMFESYYLNSNNNLSPSSAGSGGGRIKSKKKEIKGGVGQSYLITWLDSNDAKWKIAVYNYENGLLSDTIDTELNNSWYVEYSSNVIHLGGFTLAMGNGSDYKIFFISVLGELIDSKILNSYEDFQYTELAQGYLGELNDVSTLYHFVNDVVNTHTFTTDINSIEIDDGSDDDVTKDGSMVVESPNDGRYFIARPNGDLVEVTNYLDDYNLDYNTDFILSLKNNTIYAVSQDGTLKKSIDISSYNASLITDTPYGDNCGYFNFEIFDSMSNVIFAYNGNSNKFVVGTHSRFGLEDRIYTELNWVNTVSSFGKTLAVLSYEGISSNSLGHIVNRMELCWLPYNANSFNRFSLDEPCTLIIGNEEYRSFTQGENPMIMFATDSNIQIAFLNNTNVDIISSGITASLCTNVWGHNIGSSNFAVFDVGDDRIWQIYKNNVIEHELYTSSNWSWGTEGRRFSNRNGTLAVIDESNINNSFIYTTAIGLQPLPVVSGTIYNQCTLGNRTGLSSDSQLIVKKDLLGNVEGFYLLTINGLSSYKDLTTTLNGNYVVEKIEIGDTIISIRLTKDSIYSRLFVYNKTNLNLIHDTTDLENVNIYQYANRTLVVAQNTPTIITFIGINGVKTLSINANDLTFEPNEASVND